MRRLLRTDPKDNMGLNFFKFPKIKFKKKLKNQKEIWNELYHTNENVFGIKASQSAKLALHHFENDDYDNLLELGAGQGRDSVYFMNNQLDLTVVDYSHKALEAIHRKAKEIDFRGLKSHNIDVKEGLPYEDNSIDMVYSNMLYCMDFNMDEIENLHEEINRILIPGGCNVFTVRTKFDDRYGKGSYIEEDIYNINGFVNHFFDEEKINYLKAKSDMKVIDFKRIIEDDNGNDLYFVVMQKKTKFSK